MAAARQRGGLMFGFYIDKQSGITTCVFEFTVSYLRDSCSSLLLRIDVQSYMLVPVLRAPPEPPVSPSFDLVPGAFYIHRRSPPFTAASLTPSQQLAIWLRVCGCYTPSSSSPPTPQPPATCTLSRLTSPHPCSIGGVEVTGFGGKINLNNTLQSRLMLAYETRLPALRSLLFG